MDDRMLSYTTTMLQTLKHEKSNLYQNDDERKETEGDRKELLMSQNIPRRGGSGMGDVLWLRQYKMMSLCPKNLKSLKMETS